MAKKVGGVEKSAGVTETEVRDALRQLEDDNQIALFGNSKNPTVRFVAEGGAA